MDEEEEGLFGKSVPIKRSNKKLSKASQGKFTDKKTSSSSASIINFFGATEETEVDGSQSSKRHHPNASSDKPLACKKRKR